MSVCIVEEITHGVCLKNILLSEVLLVNTFTEINKEQLVTVFENLDLYWLYRKAVKLFMCDSSDTSKAAMEYLEDLACSLLYLYGYIKEKGYVLLEYY